MSPWPALPDLAPSHLPHFISPGFTTDFLPSKKTELSWFPEPTRCAPLGDFAGTLLFNWNLARTPPLRKLCIFLDLAQGSSCLPSSVASLFPAHILIIFQLLSHHLLRIQYHACTVLAVGRWTISAPQRDSVILTDLALLTP